jgi:AraC-like DNA-binding protein
MKETVMEKIMQLKTIKEYNDYMGVETRHPLVSVIEGSRMPHPVPHARKHVGMYVIFLKELRCTDDLTYGRRSYDFQENTLVFIAPGQVFGHEADGSTFTGSGWCLLFHPDLLRGTPLGRHMQDYTFFSYAANEALHLSVAEVNIFRDVLSMIGQELEHPIDKHSRELIVSNIELLLNYCLRFYDRQFITREEINHSVVKKFISLLDEYIARKAEHEGLPTVAYFADKCCYSTKYFGELVKTETGKTAKSMINDRLLSAARQLLVDETLTITQVSQRLGFEYSQHFVRFFKAQTGKTPSEYRKTA